ncbi:MAG: hypothetical protein EPN70_09455 [Paraburkholderia sp.]|uniref:hypothetical protein n=1 Tax=Paraburkholderia sp. TaxID=1926495 RepID=UPI0011FF8817|nr:hypothetical protein [Paraburkholderia sp.]TAM05143.1 MAG: hypothetical protein EPN70_09455 [Paraburkholderia sp.]TAM28858.1 MAG: hypothetical protein EPN59_14230 [Paraburkholderia sp.]
MGSTLPFVSVATVSVGAYPAAVCCGSVRFGDALRMVTKRTEFMETAWPSGYGVAAVSGFSETPIETLADEQVKEGGERKAQHLAIAVISHYELLEDAADQLMPWSRDIPFHTPHGVYIDNYAFMRIKFF